MTKAHLGWWAGERYWQCTEHVFSGDHADVRGHQCGKTATRDLDADGNPTKCAIHSAEGKAKRQAKQDAKYANMQARWKRDRVARELAAEAKDIIRCIAEGHNDPRAICIDWVSRWEQNESETRMSDSPV